MCLASREEERLNNVVGNAFFAKLLQDQEVIRAIRIAQFPPERLSRPQNRRQRVVMIFSPVKGSQIRIRLVDTLAFQPAKPASL